jgi:EF-hand domain pair
MTTRRFQLTTAPATTLILFAASTVALADQMVSFATGGYASQLRTPDMMHKIDANNDGMVSKGEWDAYQEKLFAMMDADKSDALDDQEFMHSQGKEIASFATGGFANALRTQEMLTKLDTDHDGKVSRAEFAAFQSKVFDMMDTAKTHMLDKTAFFGRGPAR